MKNLNRHLLREAQQQKRELERQAKEAAKLSALEQARLEVATFENSIEVLLSIHKEPREQWDWMAIASALRPPEPRYEKTSELNAVYEALATYPYEAQQADNAAKTARDRDKQTYEAAVKEHESECSQIEVLRELAGRVLDGEGLAFLEAFAEFNPVAEFSSAGALRRFAVDRRDLIDCAFKVNFSDTIPTEIKTLTASGKVSIKPMPKARRHELFQDYVSACTLRMAGEVLAMLPVETIIVTALADVPDSSGQIDEISILSVAFDRANLEKVNFDANPPAQVIDQFPHRCNFKVTRASGGFQPVMPFTSADAKPPESDRPDFDHLLARIKELQDEIRPAAIFARATVGRSSEAI